MITMLFFSVISRFFFENERLLKHEQSKKQSFKRINSYHSLFFKQAFKKNTPISCTCFQVILLHSLSFVNTIINRLWYF